MSDTLAVYIHWPFCKSKCPYCDFNSHETGQIDHARWCKALVRELGHFENESNGRPVGSIFFGGGTPSLMEPETVAEIIRNIKGLSGDAEITLEANPTSSEARRFTEFREAGVNRLSLGVQSLDDSALGFLGRTHSAAEAREAIGLAARTFPRFSFDLIYARPGQTVPQWRGELAQALEFGPSHLSAYQLGIEPGTRFFDDGVEELPENAAAAMFEATQDVLADLPAYEISNHARPGHECRHNMATWRGDDYVGVGPGAHGRLGRNRITDTTRQIRDPAKWLQAVEQDGHGTSERRTLSATERAEELLLSGLRTAEGIERKRFTTRCALELADVVDQNAVNDLSEAGFIQSNATHFRATPAGRQRLNAVLSRLLA
ncbi:MAG: coproporphyrinogen III oxidase [Rhodospirillales bacterium]|nr:coproporphyrinogen III oxidase [Rhodospirillales bacterium]